MSMWSILFGKSGHYGRLGEEQVQFNVSTPQSMWSLQAEADQFSRQLADKHDLRDKAVVELNRLEEVQCVLHKSGSADQKQVGWLQTGAVSRSSAYEVY